MVLALILVLALKVALIISVSPSNSRSDNYCKNKVRSYNYKLRIILYILGEGKL